MKIGEGEYKLILERLTRKESKWNKEMLNDWLDKNKEDEAKFIFVLASQPFIAQALFSRYFLGKSHNTTRKFRYLSHRDQLRGFCRGTVKVVFSSERYYKGWMIDLRREVIELAPVYDWEIVYEQDIQEKQTEEEVSG